MSRRTANRRVAAQTPKMIDCGSHGRVPWRGTVVCGKCGAPYIMLTASDPDHPRSMPRACPCGARLAPTDRTDAAFEARIACQDCWNAVVAIADGKAAKA